MLKRLAESTFTILDACWPFPLGIIAATLAFLISAGTWLAFRQPDSRMQSATRPSTKSGTGHPPILKESPPAPVDAGSATHWK